MTKNTNETNWPLIIGGAVVAIGGVVSLSILYNKFQNDKKQGKAKSSSEKKVDAPKQKETPAGGPSAASTASSSSAAGTEMSRVQLLAMFEDLYSGMEDVVKSLEQRVGDLRSRGVDQATLQQVILYGFKQGQADVQASVFEKHKCTEESATAATEKFQDDDEFKKIIAKIEVLKNQVMQMQMAPLTPEALSQVPSWLDVDKLIDFFKDMMSRLNQAMLDSRQEVQNKHPKGKLTQYQTEVDNLYLTKIKQVKDDLLSQYKLEESVLEIAILKYANDPKLTTTMMELQTNQHQYFMQLQQSDSIRG